MQTFSQTSSHLPQAMGFVPRQASMSMMYDAGTACGNGRYTALRDERPIWNSSGTTTGQTSAHSAQELQSSSRT